MAMLTCEMAAHLRYFSPVALASPKAPMFRARSVWKISEALGSSWSSRLELGLGFRVRVRVRVRVVVVGVGKGQGRGRDYAESQVTHLLERLRRAPCVRGIDGPVRAAPNLPAAPVLCPFDRLAFAALAAACFLAFRFPS